MKHPIEIINEIKEATGSSAKLAIIVANKDNEELKKAVEYAYDVLKTYNISSVDDLPPPNPMDILFGGDAVEIPATTMEDAYEALDELNYKGSASKADKLHIAKIKQGLTVMDANLLDLIVTRDMRCGVGIATWQKAYGPKFCPAWPCMLCTPYEEEGILKNITFPAYSQLKSDGARGTVVVSRREVRSRNGKPFHGLHSLIEAAEEFCSKLDWNACLDGELVLIDRFGNILPRKTGNGVINKASENTIEDDEADRIALICWDIIPEDVFFGDSESVMTYRERFELLEKLAGEFNNENHRICGKVMRIQLTETKNVHSLAEAKKDYHEKILRGEEGTILKNANSLWQPSRTTDQWKFKEEHPADVRIVEWYHGKKGTKYEKFIGGFKVATDDGKVYTGVGSGLTDKIRKDDNPDRFIGMIVEVKYNQRVMADGNDVWSLFLPRVVEIREDKDETDTLEKLIAQEIASRELKGE